MKHVLLLFAAIVLTLPSLAQQLSVSGKVIMASDGAPVPGTSVVVKGTQTGTITDVDGNFALRCDEGSTLVFSFIGMETQELAATANMTVQMEDEVSQLDEIVAVGYGVQKKSVVTASIAKVSADDLEGKTRLRAEDALKGLASGITVTSASGQPGAKSQIRIRGNGTINNSNPLYIIDGMPTDQNGMELVNPSDIESIEVLKDAASGAIYGARAANGVILVTTVYSGTSGCHRHHYQEGQAGQGPDQLQLLVWPAVGLAQARRDQRHRLCHPPKRKIRQQRSGARLCRPV